MHRSSPTTHEKTRSDAVRWFEEGRDYPYDQTESINDPSLPRKVALMLSCQDHQPMERDGAQGPARLIIPAALDSATSVCLPFLMELPLFLRRTFRPKTNLKIQHNECRVTAHFRLPINQGNQMSKLMIVLLITTGLGIAGCAHKEIHQ
jgi:hypothetical protein